MLTGLGYLRDGVTARELFEVQRVGANYGRQIMRGILGSLFGSKTGR